MSVFKRKDSPYWWGAFQLSWMSKRKLVSLRIPRDANKKYAKQELENVIIKYQGNKDHVELDVPLFFPEVKKYLDSCQDEAYHSHKITHLNFFKSFFGNVKVTDITREKVRAAHAALKNQDVRPRVRRQSTQRRQFSTINRYMSTLRAFFNRVIEDQADQDKPYITANPVKAIEFKSEDELAVERYFEEHEKKALYPIISDTLRSMIVVAVKTGMRWGEQFGMEWPQLRFEANDIYLPKTKSKKPRHIHMHPDAKAVFLSLPRYGKYVFSRPDGTPYPKNNKYHHEFMKAVKKLGFKGLTWHCFRHTYGKETAESGAPQKLQQEQMGHSTPKLTARYTHFSADFKREILNSVPSDSCYVSATLQNGAKHENGRNHSQS